MNNGVDCPYRCFNISLLVYKNLPLFLDFFVSATYRSIRLDAQIMPSHDLAGVATD